MKRALRYVTVLTQDEAFQLDRSGKMYLIQVINGLPYFNTDSNNSLIVAGVDLHLDRLITTPNYQVQSTDTTLRIDTSLGGRFDPTTAPYFFPTSFTVMTIYLEPAPADGRTVCLIKYYPWNTLIIDGNGHQLDDQLFEEANPLGLVSTYPIAKHYKAYYLQFQAAVNRWVFLP